MVDIVRKPGWLWTICFHAFHIALIAVLPALTVAAIMEPQMAVALKALLVFLSLYWIGLFGGIYAYGFDSDGGILSGPNRLFKKGWLAELFNPALKCQRTQCTMQVWRGVIFKEAPTWRRAVVDEYNAEVEICSRCGKHGELRGVNWRGGIQSMTMSDSDWAKLRERGYLLDRQRCTIDEFTVTAEQSKRTLSWSDR